MYFCIFTHFYYIYNSEEKSLTQQNNIPDYIYIFSIVIANIPQDNETEKRNDL